VFWTHLWAKGQPDVESFVDFAYVITRKIIVSSFVFISDGEKQTDYALWKNKVF
jgi:hypothetical protein